MSEGAGGEADLYMTYMFEFALPKVEQGSAEEETETKRLKGVSFFLCLGCLGMGWYANSMCRWPRWLLRALSTPSGRWSRMDASRFECLGGWKVVEGG